MSFNGLTSEDKKEIAEQAAQAIAKKLNQYNKETMDTTQYFSEAIIEAIDSIEKGIKKGATEFTKEQFLKKHNIVYDENKHFSEEEKWVWLEKMGIQKQTPISVINLIIKISDAWGHLSFLFNIFGSEYYSEGVNLLSESIGKMDNALDSINNQVFSENKKAEILKKIGILPKNTDEENRKILETIEISATEWILEDIHVNDEDMVELWAFFKYIKFVFGEEDFLKAIKSITELEEKYNG